MTTKNICLFRLINYGIGIISLISLLAACGDRSTSKTLLASSVDMAAKTSQPQQCFRVVGQLSKQDDELFAASKVGDVQRVVQAIDAGANIKATDALKRTPLFAAAFCNQPEVANLLIEKGSDVNAKDFIGISPLYAAVADGWDAVTKTLISKGADINIRNSRGRTPLHLAAATNQVVMVELLLAHGADSQVRDNNGLTAALLASDNDHKKISSEIKEWQEKHKSSIQK